MKRITIIFKKGAMSLLPKINSQDTFCYYLSDDYAFFLSLQKALNEKITIRNLEGLFDSTFQEIQGPFLELVAKINREYNSREWWGGQIASRSTSATPLLLNVNYLFCAKKILAGLEKNYIFIVDSQALSECISSMAGKCGYEVLGYRKGIIAHYKESIKHRLLDLIYMFSFLKEVFKSRRAAFTLLKPVAVKKTQTFKRIVIRTWITQDAFNAAGQFQNRNFGILPDWLRSKNYEIVILPLFFNLRNSLHEIYSLIKNQEQAFLIQDHYLKWSDYFMVINDAFRSAGKHIKKAEIENIDIAPLFNEILKQGGIRNYPCIFNLCYPLLKRLKERGFEIDGFYYPFENQLPEKPFILGCRTFYPQAKIIGFQHTAFYPNHLSHHFVPVEKGIHPLPDKIVCSGPVYMRLHKAAGFPEEILFAGPNLRYESVYRRKDNNNCNNTNKIKLFLLPLTFSYNLAFELFLKVKEALQGFEDYKVYIRNHPLLSKEMIVKFLHEIKMQNVEFAEGGIFQDWLVKSQAVISTGGSITIVEAAVMGVPVIRLVPENTFFYDPFAVSNYPFKPVSTSFEIRAQIKQLDKIKNDAPDTFCKIAEQILFEYFTKPDERNLQVFL